MIRKAIDTAKLGTGDQPRKVSKLGVTNLQKNGLRSTRPLDWHRWANFEAVPASGNQCLRSTRFLGPRTTAVAAASIAMAMSATKPTIPLPFPVASSRDPVLVGSRITLRSRDPGLLGSQIALRCRDPGVSDHLEISGSRAPGISDHLGIPGSRAPGISDHLEIPESPA